jgi:cysteinyl-tRNA synthetase
MHNGFVRLQDQKMSKSTGNVATIRELLKLHDAEVIRFFVLRAHYRSPLNYTDEHLRDARQALSRCYTALKGLPIDAGPPDWSERNGRRFREAMDDDFNTPEAVAALFDLANEANRTDCVALKRQLRALGGLLGILGRESEEFLQSPAGPATGVSEARIESLIKERNEARSSRNFRRADEIRDELLRDGIVLEDGSHGTSWRRA